MPQGGLRQMDSIYQWEIVPRENMLSQNGHEHYVDRWRMPDRELRERIPLYVRT